MSKPRDIKLYWETFLTDDNEPYYYCAATNTTVWERPSAPAIILKEHWAAFPAEDEGEGEDVYFCHGETEETTYDLDLAIDLESTNAGSIDGKPVYIPAKSSIPIVHDLTLYWQTFHEDDGDIFYFNEALDMTTRDYPTEPRVPRNGTKPCYPIVLPVGWIVAMDDDDHVYFADENDNATYDLPLTASSVSVELSSSRASRNMNSPSALVSTVTDNSFPNIPNTPASRRAFERLRTAMRVWQERRALGLYGVRSRPRIFFNVSTDTYLIVDAMCQASYRRILAVPTLRFSACLFGSDAIYHGFDDSRLKWEKSPHPLTYWNETLDNTTGRYYYFNLDTKETAWELPPGGRVVARIVGKNHPAVLAARRLQSLVTLLQPKRKSIGDADVSEEAEALAAQAEAALQMLSPTKERGIPTSIQSWLYKSGSNGRNFQKRWLVADGFTGQLSWYLSAPASSATTPTSTKERPKGFMDVKGCTVEYVSADRARGLPTPYCVDVRGSTRSIRLCAATPELATSWHTYLFGLSSGVVQRALERDQVGSPDSDVGLFVPTPRSEAWIEVSLPEGGWVSMFASVDVQARLLLLFNSEKKEPGSERAAVDLLGSDVSRNFPAVFGAPQPNRNYPTLWIDSGEDPIFGKLSDAGPVSVISAFAFPLGMSQFLKWADLLEAACDASTMAQLSPEEKSAAPIISTILMHSMRGAGIFSSMHGFTERKVIVHPASKTLTVFSDTKGSKVSVVLRLGADGFRLKFGAHDKALKGYGNLYIEILAPVVGINTLPQTHIFRTKSHVDYVAWVAALAAL